ncbi:hypothetical protein L7F22_019810 [Adiantum nelumboides]|nr:hypothetical protein [Adiantum nelumboides]
MWTSFHPRRSSNWSLDDHDRLKETERNAQHKEQQTASSSRIQESTSPIFRADDLHHIDGKGGLLQRAKDPRIKGSRPHPSLWQLQIGETKLDRRNNDASIEERNGLSTTSSSPASSRRATLTERASSASPPSPFGISHSDCSPPSTPPDALSSGSSSVPFSSKRHWNLLGQDANEKSEAKINDSIDPRQRVPAPAGATTVIQPLPKSSSRNDIFSASSPSMQPAPRLPSVVADAAGTPTPATRRQDSIKKRNRQSGFFYGSQSDASSSYPSPIRPSDQSPIQTTSRLLLNVDDSDRPGYGRSNTEERERERERIRQTNMEIEFRLCPIKELMLGEGRHSNVYLGAYRVKEEVQNPSFEVDENEDHEWRLCAMKRPHADRQSQLLALEEAFALRRLGPHPNIIRLIKIRDEVQLSRPNSPRIEGNQEAKEGQSQNLNQTGQAGLGIGLPSNFLAPTSVRARATSEVNALEKSPEKGRSQANTGMLHHRRMISQPESSSEAAVQPSVRIVAPDAVESHSPQIDDRAGVLRQAETDTSRNDAPRLLMLLELLPFSLSSFSRRNPELVDYEQWRTWALELAGVVEWMHSRGCIHADLKPENILLTSDLHVKLCDFNSALFPNASTPLMDGIGLGTPAYGAPELSRSLNKSSDSSNGFSYPVDIWSLGAILYTLATGNEPFRRARSMIDMVYRKRVFFESEENDRVARMSVAEGSSTAGPASYYAGTIGGKQGSLPASRKSSIRGRKSDNMASTTTSTPLRSQAYSMHKRAPSTESVSSINSSMVVSSSSGMRPSIQAINILLDDRTPTGLLTIPGSPQMALRNIAAVNSTNPNDGSKHAGTFATINGHHRASSMGKAQSHQFAGSTHARGQQRWSSQGTEAHDKEHGADASLASPRTNTMLDLLNVRPDSLRRTTSYNGQDANANTSQPEVQSQERESDEAHLERTTSRGSLSSFTEDSSRASISPPSSISRKTGENAELRLAVAAAFARSANYAPPISTSSRNTTFKDLRKMSGDLSTFSLQDQSRSEYDLEHELNNEEQEDLRAYHDGTPALLFPGGGRLPDQARNLLERMLRTDPAKRPTASQVRAVLESL